MEIATATHVVSEYGPLTRIVNDFCARQGALMAVGISSSQDWDPLLEFIDAKQFRRVGAYLEKLSWPEYREFLTRWLAGGTRFEMTVFHITEVGNAVFQEIEERHYRGDDFIKKNVIAVYRFNDCNKIIHLDIYEQAQDSGRWIVEAAYAATSRV